MIISALLGLIACFIVAALLLYRRRSAAPRLLLLVNLCVAMISLLLVLLGGELYFRSVHRESDGFSFSLAARNWFRAYWMPMTRQGYRDREHPPQEFEGRRTLIVVGDSIAAGHGIENPRDRFSDLLGQQLGDSWTVVNIAISGWGTRKEYAALLGYPHKPDAVVLSYYINDIEDELPAPWLGSRNLSREIGNPLVDESYLGNFIYWRLYRLRAMDKDYLDYVIQGYRDPLVWNAHAADLKKFVMTMREHQIKLVVVIFPHLQAIEKTRPLTEQVEYFLSAYGVTVVNMSTVLEGRAVRDMTVNRVDAHPNESVHREVADLLLPLLR